MVRVDEPGHQQGARQVQRNQVRVRRHDLRRRADGGEHPARDHRRMVRREAGAKHGLLRQQQDVAGEVRRAERCRHGARTA